MRRIGIHLNSAWIFIATLLFMSCNSKNKSVATPEENGSVSTKPKNTPVTKENFATAESYRFFKNFTEKGAVNRFIHENKIAGVIDNETITRSNIDMFYSHAIVDISEGATITLPDSKGRFRMVQIIDENAYTSQVLYDAGTYKITSNSGATFVYAFMRTSANPMDEEDQKEAKEIMKNTIVNSTGCRTFFDKYRFDEIEVIAMRTKIISEYAERYRDCFGAFGDVEDIKDPDKFIFGAAAGWGGLPEKYAVYWPISPNLGDSPAILTIKKPPVDQYWSITVYDSLGWLASDNALRTPNNTKPNKDGSITFHFGCGDDALNNIPITKNWSFVLRMYGPKKEILNGTYKPVMPTIIKK